MTTLLQCVITSIFILFGFSALYSAPLIIDKSMTGRSAGLYLDYLEDRGCVLGIEDVSGPKYDSYWKKSDKESPGFGFTKSAYWVRLTVRNDSAADIEFYLEQGFGHIDYLTLYSPDAGRFKATLIGDYLPFGERPIDHRNLVFPMKIKAGSISTYFLQYKTTSGMNIVLKVWSPSEFHKAWSREYYILMLYYGMMLVMIVYNMCIYIFIRRSEYLYYFLFILFFMMTSMSLNGTSFQFLWPDFPLWHNYNPPLFLCLLMVFAILFVLKFTDLKKIIPRTHKVAVGLLIVQIVILAASLVIPYKYSMQISAGFAGLAIAYAIFYSTVLCFRKHRQAYFYLAAWGAISAGGLIFILKAFGILQTNFFTEWSLQIGSVIMVLIFSTSFSDNISMMSQGIEKAEMKYRSLVESSADIIFSLDEDLNFLNVNVAIKKTLDFTEKDVIGKNFLDFIHETSNEKNNITRMMVDAYIADLKRTGLSVSFRSFFKKKFSHEPQEMTVRLEQVKTEVGVINILGKASLVTDDIILQHMDSEKHVYTIDNYLNKAELLCQRLTRNLTKFIDSSRVFEIRVALREMIINAIEHGNLNISFAEKTKTMMEENYFNFIQERQNDPRYRDKKIIIEYQLSENMVEYKITDQGEGFDHQTMINSETPDVDEDIIPHGRGLLITMNSFDVVKYNDKGNQVTLIKYFRKIA
jgi:PAS domain-containing protein